MILLQVIAIFIVVLLVYQMALLFAHSAGILPKVSVVPRETIGGVNGRNNAFWVRIADDLNADDFMGVRAQEVWESGFKARLWNAFRVRMSDDARREMEFRGHALEILEHPLAVREEILAREVATLIRPGAYDGIFEGWSPANIERELRSRL